MSGEIEDTEQFLVGAGADWELRKSGRKSLPVFLFSRFALIGIGLIGLIGRIGASGRLATVGGRSAKGMRQAAQQKSRRIATALQGACKGVLLTELRRRRLFEQEATVATEQGRLLVLLL